MSNLFLKDKWLKLGAKFENICTHEAVKNVASFDEEYDAMRKTAVFADFSFVKKFSYSENAGLDFLDTVLAANLLKLRYGRMMATFLANQDGSVAAECFAANIDDKVFLICENICSDEYLLESLKSPEADFEDITESCAMFSIDGPLAWKVACKILGDEVMNLPYLSIEKFDFESEPCYLMRNGKTGEFGYQFLISNSVAEKLFDKIMTALNEVGGKCAGLDIHSNARLEGGFFNIYAEGKTVKDPLKMGLQWMIDFGKESFAGSAKIFENRKNTPSEKLVCVKSSADIFKMDAPIFNGANIVGKIVAKAVSKNSNSYLALALFDDAYAYSGFDFASVSGGTADLQTISRPSIITLSLQNGADQA